MNFVSLIVTVPNRGNVSPAVQIPDDSTSIPRPAHDNGPRSAGSDASYRALVTAHDMGDRDAGRYSVAAHQLPESNRVIVAPRCHVFTVGEGYAVARNGLDDLNHLGCKCQQRSTMETLKVQTFRSAMILTSSNLPTPRVPLNLLFCVRWDRNHSHRTRSNATYRIYEDGMHWAPSSKI
jgi:hypothetical protein